MKSQIVANRHNEPQVLKDTSFSDHERKISRGICFYCTQLWHKADFQVT